MVAVEVVVVAEIAGTIARRPKMTEVKGPDLFLTHKFNSVELYFLENKLYLCHAFFDSTQLLVNQGVEQVV